jgi:hypothetical protein
MGLLALGTPLPWSDAKQHAEYVREHGIEQFLNIYHRLKDRTGDRLLWGDEVRGALPVETGTSEGRRAIADESERFEGGRKRTVRPRELRCWNGQGRCSMPVRCRRATAARTRGGMRRRNSSSPSCRDEIADPSSPSPLSRSCTLASSSAPFHLPPIVHRSASAHYFHFPFFPLPRSNTSSYPTMTKARTLASPSAKLRFFKASRPTRRSDWRRLALLPQFRSGRERRRRRRRRPVFRCSTPSTDGTCWRVRQESHMELLWRICWMLRETCVSGTSLTPIRAFLRSSYAHSVWDN